MQDQELQEQCPAGLRDPTHQREAGKADGGARKADGGAGQAAGLRRGQTRRAL